MKVTPPCPKLRNDTKAVTFRVPFLARILMLTLALFAGGVSTAAQSGGVFRIGLSVWSGYPDSVRGFKEGLAVGGFVEGENIEFLQGGIGLLRSLEDQGGHAQYDAQSTEGQCCSRGIQDCR